MFKKDLFRRSFLRSRIDKEKKEVYFNTYKFNMFYKF